MLAQQFNKKCIQVDERLDGNKIYLRLTIPDDCNQTYLNWLNDPEINQYLETRWYEQTLKSIGDFILSMLEDPTNYLFAIIEKDTFQHIGNIKLGPINYYHDSADISYFIGDKNKWGKGYASEAIQLISSFGFNRLNLHRLQAGLYRSNVGSAYALEKAGYAFDGAFRQKLRGYHGWEDHVWYCMIR